MPPTGAASASPARPIAGNSRLRQRPVRTSLVGGGCAPDRPTEPNSPRPDHASSQHDAPIIHPSRSGVQGLSGGWLKCRRTTSAIASKSRSRCFPASR